MIAAGTRVNLAIDNSQDQSPLIDLLNTLDAEVLQSSVEADLPERVYIVAFEVEHMEAIQQATNKEFRTKNRVQLPIVGLNRFLGRPKDPRFWYTVYSNEVTPT